MIFTERTITVVNDSATINKPLILYRGDKNIELKITIAESQFKFRNNDASNVIETTDASYAQLVINTPYNSPIFSDVAATKNGAVIFVITEAMIDEIREVGAYEIQIRLLDDNKQSRASIPPVSNAIEIREPIAIEDGSAVDSNAVNVAKVNRALTTTSAPLEAFDSQGNYIKKTWGDGDPITDAALNKMEVGIDGVNKKIGNARSQIKDIANKTITTEERTKLASLENYDDTTVKANIQNVQQQVNNLVLGAVGDGNNAEVIQARGIYDTLNDRINNKLDISNIRKLKVSNIPKTDGARISCNNGDILNIPGWSYINLDVSNVKYMLIITKNLGASDLGCAFYDSTNTFISGIRTGDEINVKLIIPENAKYFKYGLNNSDWEDYKDNYITLCYNVTNFNDLNNKVTMLEENDKENQPELGIMDNKLPYLWHKYGNLYNLNNPVNYSNSREKNSLYVSGDHHTQSGVVSPSFTSYFTIKKSDSITYYTVRNQSGAVCEFNDATISTGDVICQTDTANKMVDVIYVDDEKIVISIIETVKAYTINAFSDKNYTIAAELKIDIDKSSVFYTVYDKNSINYNYKYLSRAEKLNSKIMGKNLFIFSDSQSSFINVLAQDYGANVFHITNGGCRMGYVSDTGLGGETGSNNDLWLCNSTRVNNFNNLFLNNEDLKMDYIINFTGGNGPFENIGTADELKYILSHKKWFGDNSQDDLFDTLSLEDKLRFTSPLCYLASFITINKVFPRAIPVVCDLYNYVGGSYSFTNETWENLNDLVDIMYNENAGGKKKSLLLHDLAKMIGAILVKASECGYAYTNIPYYGSDRVHGNFQSATNLAHLIANHISFVPRIEEQYLEEK